MWIFMLYVFYHNKKNSPKDKGEKTHFIAWSKLYAITLADPEINWKIGALKQEKTRSQEQ